MKTPSALLLIVASRVAAYDTLLAFNEAPVVETRSIDAIHAAAVAEGGVVTVWHGGDETYNFAYIKSGFEARFPGMTLNLTIDVSKYHDGNIDRQLAAGNLYVDSAILQTVQDYPRWDREGALMHYAPLNFDAINAAYKDVHAAWYGYMVVFWGMVYNTNKTSTPATDYADFLKPEFKDKLVLTYPNDDDAVLWQFDLIMSEYGLEWFDALLEQNPRWVRGTTTPNTLMSQANNSLTYSFTSSVGLAPSGVLNYTLPSKGMFTTWAQTAAIFKDAPHPEGAKLLVNYLLSDDFQNTTTMWSVREDIPVPKGGAHPALNTFNRTNIDGFARYMEDRERVERLRLYIESKIGTPQGLSPLIDGI